MAVSSEMPESKTPVPEPAQRREVK
jgi:hypothetical protein